MSGVAEHGMKLRKLSAAPSLALQAELGRRCRLMPAPADGRDAGTASQLIDVRWTRVMCCVFVVCVTSSLAHAAAGEIGPAQLIGVWRGTSICTDLTAAPACHDETVVYEFTAGSRPGAVHWAADKVVGGQRERMGEMELEYDKAEGCWKAFFTSPRTKSVWRLTVEGSRLTGTARLLPGNETIRKLDLRKE